MPTPSRPRPVLGEPVRSLPESAAAGTPKVEEMRPRQCGRCRAMFEGDPSLHPTAIPEWWLCGPCRSALLGGGRSSGRRIAR